MTEQNNTITHDDLEKIIKNSVMNKPRIRLLNEKELEQWTMAIHEACRKEWCPALRAAYAHLTPFVDEGSSTAYTDCSYRIGLSPDMLDPEKTTIQQLTMIMIHETMHNTQHHRQRIMENKDISGTLANFATDLEINSIIAEGILGIDIKRGPSPMNGKWDYLFGKMHKLEEEEAEAINARKNTNGNYAVGHEVHKGNWWYSGGLLPGYAEFHEFDTGLTAENYLALLEEKQETTTIEIDGNEESDEQGNGNNGGVSNGNNDSQENNGNGAGNWNENSSGGSGNGNSGSAGITPVDASSTGDGYGSLSGKKTTIYVKNSDGSKTKVSESTLFDQINIKPDDPLWDEVSKLGVNPISRSEEQSVRDQITHDIEKERLSNNYGNEAGNMLLNYIAKGLRPPVVDWRKVLRNAATNACQEKRKGQDDYTYSRRSRRYSRGKYIFPGMVSYVPSIRFAIDTSGSMSENEYQKALSEIEGVLRTTKSKIECVCVDTETSEIMKVKNVKEIAKNLRGGGGTDMGAALTQIAKEKPRERPDILVIATDGCYNWESFMRDLEKPELHNVIPIIALVYKYDEDRYYAEQSSITKIQHEIAKHHPKAKLVAAWA